MAVWSDQGGMSVAGTKIFYFSGSGNAVAIARSIAEGLENAVVEPVARYPEGYTGADEERIGLVTPVYAWGSPRMVTEFAEKLRSKTGQYVFAVATCAGAPGRTVAALGKKLRRNGGRLDAGFAVRNDFTVSLPGMGDMAIVRLVGWLGRNHVPELAGERLPEIIEAVKAKRASPPEGGNASANAVGSLVHGVAMTTFKTLDKGFAATDACTSCGTCANLCPRANITMVDGRPKWNGNCEACYACLVWCPESAITMNGLARNEPSHHPEITVADMLLR